MKFLACLLAICASCAAFAQEPVDYAGDAKALDGLIVENYAYQELWPDGALPDSPALRAQRDAVSDGKSLLAYAEARIASLADHHAITGSSFSNSWALVPSFADLWVEKDADGYRIDSVRAYSPAAKAGIRAGDRVTKVGGVSIADAVRDYWNALGLQSDDRMDAYAARVLLAGRRDRARVLTLDRGGAAQEVRLTSLYDWQFRRPSPLTVSTMKDGAVFIRLHDSLGNHDTIAAFDAVMAGLSSDDRLVIDLRDTASGGNSTVARAIMGWFVDRPTPYQRHDYPVEERTFGFKRSWIEEVSPRADKYHPTLPTLLVDRWTGSMGEGLAVGFDAMGATVCGEEMAGLLGAIYDLSLPSSGLIVKIPVERLSAMDGTPREDFVPDDCGDLSFR